MDPTTYLIIHESGKVTPGCKMIVLRQNENSYRNITYTLLYNFRLQRLHCRQYLATFARRKHVNSRRSLCKVDLICPLFFQYREFNNNTGQQPERFGSESIKSLQMGRLM